MILTIVAGGFYYSGRKISAGNNQVIVYNWGEYIDPEVLSLFEEETGIQVIYEEYETNEIMYPKIKSGAVAYDAVCPSDYMIQKMIDNGLLAKINWDNIPNIENIGEIYLDKSREFDQYNEYSVPYCWGTVGILYNKTMVSEPFGQLADSVGVSVQGQHPDAGFRAGRFCSLSEIPGLFLEYYQ